VQRAVRYHHEPERATAECPPPAGTVDLSEVIQKADAYVNYLGMSLLPTLHVPPDAPALEFPGFPNVQKRVLTAFEGEIKTLCDMFR
jgi:hypothetical protein